MDNEPQLTPNERAILEKELPDRSFVLEDHELSLANKESHVDSENRLTSQEVKESDGNVKWRKTIKYKQEKDPVTKRDRNTDEIDDISEAEYEYNPDGSMARVRGRDLHREHDYEADFTYSKTEKGGDKVVVDGRATKGEELGAEWHDEAQFEKIGDYTKKTRTNSGKHYLKDPEDHHKFILDKNGQKILKPFSTYKINYNHPSFVTDKNKDGNFLYYSIEYDENGQEVPAAFQFDLKEPIPEGFAEKDLIQTIQERQQTKAAALAAARAAKEAEKE